MRKAFICPTKYVQGEDEILNLGYFVKTFGESALLIAHPDDVDRVREKLERTAEKFQIITDVEDSKIGKDKITLKNIIYMVDAMSACVIQNEIPFCELDSYAGDGDFGMSVSKGFKQLKREWKEMVEEHGTSIGEFLDACSMVIMEYCGGASGPIWGSAFRMAGKEAGAVKKRIF